MLSLCLSFFSLYIFSNPRWCQSKKKPQNRACHKHVLTVVTLFFIQSALYLFSIYKELLISNVCKLHINKRVIKNVIWLLCVWWRITQCKSLLASHMVSEWWNNFYGRNFFWLFAAHLSGSVRFRSSSYCNLFLQLFVYFSRTEVTHYLAAWQQEKKFKKK